MKKFFNTIPEEQETIIHIDYFAKTVSLYTSSEVVYNKCLEKLGNPNKTFFVKKKVSGASWVIPFSDKIKSNFVFSRPLMIGRRK